MSSQPPAYPPPGQQPGYPPPPGQQPGYPPPPAKSSTGKTCGIIAAIVGGLVILGIIGLVVLGSKVVDAVKAPADQTNAYLSDVQMGNTSSAYDRLCSSFKSRYSYSDFENELDAAEDKYGSVTSYNVTSINIVNSTATVQYTLNRQKGSQTYTATLIEEGGAWKLCSFST